MPRFMPDPRREPFPIRGNGWRKVPREGAATHDQSGHEEWGAESSLRAGGHPFR